MDIQQVIKQRRSIRKYKPDMPSDDLVQQVLEAARNAPSWANTQCWQFIIVTETGTKQQLAETLPEKNPARKSISQAPIVIAACARTGVSGYFKGNAVTDKGDWLMFDTALALQNLSLCACSLGLGTVHTGFFDAEKVRTILNIPSEIAIIELLPLGFPDEDGITTPRKPLADFVFYEQHGNTDSKE